MIERETLIYERIARSIAYTNNGDVRDHSIVGPVLLSTGVCEGKNALLLLCFRRIGIPCVKVYGRTKTDGRHGSMGFPSTVMSLGMEQRKGLYVSIT